MSQPLVFGHAIDGCLVEIAGPEAIDSVDLHQLGATAGAPIIVHVRLRTGEVVRLRGEHLTLHGRTVLKAMGVDPESPLDQIGAP